MGKEERGEKKGGREECMAKDSNGSGDNDYAGSWGLHRSGSEPARMTKGGMLAGPMGATEKPSEPLSRRIQVRLHWQKFDGQIDVGGRY